jgi:hypothetical protein
VCSRLLLHLFKVVNQQYPIFVPQNRCHHPEC